MIELKQDMTALFCCKAGGIGQSARLIKQMKIEKRNCRHEGVPEGSATLGETGVRGERQGMGLEPDSAGLRKTGCLGLTLFAEGDR